MKRRSLSLALLLAIATGSLMADGTLITLDLSRPTVPSSFPLASNRIWTGTYSNACPEISFNNGIFRLSHVVDRDAFGSENQWGYWDGFTYSKNGDNTNYGAGNSQSWVACQFGNMAGGGIQTDAAGNVRKDASGAVMVDRDIPYLVAYWGYYKILFGSSVRQTLEVTLDNIYKAVGVYVNNSPWPYFGNSGGDSFARPFDRDGDYFKLIVHGLDGSGRDNGRTVEHFFARNINGVLHQSPGWEWVDLSALGEVGGIYFTMASTDNDPIVGMNTAAYFCMDKLTVSTPAASVVPVTGISLSHAAIALTVGESMQLTANIYPSDAGNKALTWTSTAPSIVHVSSNGTITALSSGTATITARTADGGYAATCAVTVSASSSGGGNAVTGVSLSRSSVTLNVGEIIQLSATVYPANAANKALVWTSTNEATAIVFSDGQVLGMSAGTATITARTLEGGFTSACTVTVRASTGNAPVASSIAVYPNPFADYIIIETTKAGEAALYDISGKTVLRTKLTAGSNRINTSALPKGVYILKYEGGMRKMVK